MISKILCPCSNCALKDSFYCNEAVCRHEQDCCSTCMGEIEVCCVCGKPINLAEEARWYKDGEPVHESCLRM